MKKIPKFRTEDAERHFWARADSDDYIDWRTVKRAVLSELRPSQIAISIRLPEMMLEQLKVLSNKVGVPYKSLIKIFLSERIKRDLAGHQ